MATKLLEGLYRFSVIWNERKIPNISGEGLFNFQEKILVKFGFIPFHDPTTDNQRQFVHVSGSIFVMIPSKNPASSPHKSVRKRGKFLKVWTNFQIKISHLSNQLKVDDNDTACSPHEEYITRHFSGVKQAGESARIDAKVSNQLILLVSNHLMLL